MSFREWLYFQKSDRIVIVTFMLVILVCVTVFLIFDDGEMYSTSNPDDSISFVSRTQQKRPFYRYYRVEGRKIELFAFDPNTADSTQLLRLGLQPWQVRNIYKYRAMGGVYRKASDFARVYGLTQGQYRALEPYIHIGKDYQPAADLFPKERQKTRDRAHTALMQKMAEYPVKLREGQKMQINTADTSQLMKIPGIGSYYAKEIVRLRDRLGGFYSSAQLKQIEGFPDDALRYIDVDKNEIHKININKLSFSDLRRHPYINYYQARAIDEYKRLHGPLTEINQLRLLKCFSTEDLERLRPYIEIEK